jgi:type VI secretion system protein ImpH
MAAEEREPTDPLKLAEALLAHASRADFFSLVPLLERLSPNATRVGGDGPPSKEALRFRHDPSMAFSAGDIASGTLAQVLGDPNDSQSRRHAVMQLTTTFLGLTGSVSPLPLYIPAEVAQSNSGENLQANFLDIFHHRLLSLFYRLWTRYQYAREFTANCDDVWSQRVLALCAPTAESRTRPSRIPRHKLLKLAPLLSPRSRSARGLELALEEVLDLPDGHAHIAQLVGGYTPIDEDQRMRLSQKTAILGRGALLGSQAYERGNRFCIRLGPMSASEYPHYIGKGARIDLVREVVNLMVREPFDYDLELLLGGDALPGFLISAQQGMTLGVTTRLRAAGGQQSVMVRNVGRRIAS